ncbi:MAG: hypothetical protein AAGC70_19360 [Pseudomonadota bacterium]
MGFISKSFVALCGTVMLAVVLSVHALGQQSGLRQIELTEDMIKRFITAQQELKGRAKEIESANADEAKLTALLNTVAKKAGFASFEEFDVVAANVTLIIAGIDPETGAYTDPKEAIRVEVKEIKVDKTLSEDERKKLLAELEEALKSTPDVKHPDNIKLVQKLAKDIEVILE